MTEEKRGRGRPPKDEDKKLSRRLQIRISEDELRAVEKAAKAEGQSPAALYF